MDHKELIQDFKARLHTMKQAQDVLHEDLLGMETWLSQSLEDVTTVNTRLKELLAKKDISRMTVKTQPEPEALSEKSQPSAEDFGKQMEKLLQGSLDALGDKISDKILNMMKELKTMSGPMRAQKISEIKAAADSELVDLSSLFAFDTVESNIEEVGVDEKEVKGIDKSLERLRQMKQRGKK